MPDQYYIYETIEGDTFDCIALDFYNQENLASKIIEANPEQRKTLVFHAGVELIIPIVEKAVAESLPPWKRGE